MHVLPGSHKTWQDGPAKMNGQVQEAYVTNNEAENPSYTSHETNDAVKGKAANDAGKAGKGTKRWQNVGTQNIARVPWKGDWSCPSCDFLNFARNNTCKGRYECNTPKPEKKTQKAIPPNDYNVHDWKCENCGDVVFKRRTTCRKCQTPIRLTPGTVAVMSPIPQAQAAENSPRTSSNESNESTRVPASDDKSAEDTSEPRDTTTASQRPVPEMRTQEACVKPTYNRVAPVMPRWVGKENALHNFVVSAPQRIVHEKHQKYGMDVPRCATEENRHSKYSVAASQQCVKESQSAEAPRRIDGENKRLPLDGGRLGTTAMPPWETDHSEGRKKHYAEMAPRLANRNTHNKQGDNVLREKNLHNMHNARIQQCHAAENMSDRQVPDASTPWSAIPKAKQDAHNRAATGAHTWVSDDHGCNSNIAANQRSWLVDETAHEKRSVNAREWLTGKKKPTKSIPPREWLDGHVKDDLHTDEVARFPVVRNVHPQYSRENGKGALSDNAQNMQPLEAYRRTVVDDAFHEHCWEASKCAFGSKGSAEAVRGSNGPRDNTMLWTRAGEHRIDACRALGDDRVCNSDRHMGRWSTGDAPVPYLEELSVPSRQSPPMEFAIESTFMKVDPPLALRAGANDKTVITSTTGQTRMVCIEFDGDVPDEKSLENIFQECGAVLWAKVQCGGNATASLGGEKALKKSTKIGAVHFRDPEGVENALKKYPGVPAKPLPTIKYQSDSHNTICWSNDAVMPNDHAALWNDNDTWTDAHGDKWYRNSWNTGNMYGAAWGNEGVWRDDWSRATHRMCKIDPLCKEEAVRSI